MKALQRLANNLRRLRGERTQKEMADIIGVHFTAYNRFERAEREPRLDLLCRIAESLNTNISELLKQ